MKLGKLFGIPIILNVLTIPFAALALFMGEGALLLTISASVLLHELSHIAAARLMRVGVSELELMPLGGAARVDGLWKLRPHQLVTVSLAGPACNLIIILIVSALCWWEVLDPYWTFEIISANTMIFAFNMLPALPLDGGRVVCGLLETRMSPGRAARICVASGVILSALLAIYTVMSAVAGQINITFLLASVYLLMSGRREIDQAESSVMRSIMSRSVELNEEGVMPVMWLAAPGEASALEIVKKMRPRYIHFVAVYDGDMRHIGTLSEEVIIDALMNDGSVKLFSLMGRAPLTRLAPEKGFQVR